MSPENIVIDKAVAAVAASRIKELFGGARRGMARVRSFTAAEVARMVELLEDWAGDEVELVVISAKPLSGVAESHLIEEGKSATTYRNEVGSCVFFEVDRFSDQQGLKNVTLLDDGNLLREGAPGPRAAGLGMVNSKACLDAFDTVWQIKRDYGGPAPQTVLGVVEELVGEMNEHQRQPALREWISFAARSCEELGSNQPIDAPAARKAVGKALPALKLFPDPDLEEISGQVPRTRRFAENVLASEDRTRSGREIDRDELVELVDTIEFRDLGGEALSGQDLKALRQRLKGYLQAHRKASTEGIEFRFWRQLFEHTTRRRGVGTKVRDEIEDTASERLDELEELDVIEELNAKEAEAAQRLLDEEPAEVDDVALSDLLSSRLRKAVERIANPTAKATTQPLRHVLRLFHALAEEGDDVGRLHLEVRKSHGTETRDRFSKALFSFLYGGTLGDVAERSGGTFDMADELKDPSPLKDWVARKEGEQADGDEELEEEWETLRLQLRWADESSGAEFFEWRPESIPGFAAMAKAVLQPDTWRWKTPSLDFDDWCEKALEPGALIGGDPSAPSGALADEWLSQRKSVLDSIGSNGLSPGPLRDYVAIWATLLERAYQEHVPHGASDPVVDEFLSVDVHSGPDEVPTMLATHPLRLRWIGINLAKLSDQLVDARRGKLRLNEVNEGFFFDRTAQASPHEQPPVLCDDAHVYVAVRETCWHERYEVVRTRDRTLTDWLADLDDSSLDEMAAALGRYVDAFPFKADGLHLLIVAREGGARMIRELVGRFLGQSGLTGRRSDMRMFLHVVCPPKEFSPVSDAIAEFDDGSGRAEHDFPRFRVVLHEWPAGESTPPFETLPERVDIAVVPNLFSASTRCQEATRSAEQAEGEFDPWLDRPTVRQSASEGLGAKTVSRVLLPEQRDDLLAYWSTVNVRHYRGSVVGTGTSGRDDVDIVTLSVAVTDGESFFAQLHERAHWVVTLDAFVGRRQIEALEHRPEVITVKPGLGKGGAYTLVVSSQAGREFVVHRLTRRLRQQIGTDLGVEPQIVAEKIYDRARELAPGTLLRALGLGRTAQELVGLVVSQRLTRQFAPVDIGDDGFESWVALDERPDWFAGNRSSRADLLRICGVDTEEGLKLSLTVVEAKLRDQSGIRKAESQLDSTTALFEQALVPLDDDPPHDGEFWRRAVLDAIDESAREPTTGGGWTFRAKWGGKAHHALTSRVRDALRRGNYLLETVRGVACTVSEGPSQDARKTPNGEHSWIRASRKEVAQVLQEIGRENATDIYGQESGAPDSAADMKESETSEAPTDDPGKVEVDTRGAKGDATSSSEGLSDDELISRYQRVLDTFAEYGVEVERDSDVPIEEGPGFFVFRVRPGTGVQPAKLISQSDNLKYALGLPAELQPRAFIDRGAVVFEVPKAEDERYYVDADELWNRVNWPGDRLWVAVGEDVAGDIVAIDFSSNETPHLLIGGITGAGKSVALETIILGLIRHYPSELLRIAAVDPKRTELAFLEDYPLTTRFMGFDSEDALHLLDSMVEEMESRYESMRDHRVKSLHELNEHLEPEKRKPWHLVVLDEFADLTSDRDAKKAIEASLQRLTQKARAAGIHVIVATQKPSADVISTTVRSNLGAQLALRVKTATDSRIIMDATGAEALAGNGDAFLKGAGTAMTRLQCAKVGK